MTAEASTVDAFHRGRFHLVQPKGRGHRAGMDAMLLAAMVEPKAARGGRGLRVADLGAGAGAAGFAVAARIPEAEVSLFELSPEMAEFARRSLALAENAAFQARMKVFEADVALTGVRRNAAGLADDAFDHVIMNPPFNAAGDRKTPDRLKQVAHAMEEGLFEAWIRTAGAILKPGGQLSLIARPQSLADIIAACGMRFGGIEITPVHARAGEDAFRILTSAIKGSRARLALRPPIIMHDVDGHAFLPEVDDLNNGRACYPRRQTGKTG
ncbi:tRNA1(Val) (adenine(37)-N6)-methyltransferase [Martelella mediterranea]|uniref:tRNA1(Val) (adenine(37)-N6)-methyltransferase n=1 Tax=Martelella mediterranea TaxID=293089 RepID=UPI001E29C68E|nr:tRNA1(Val) (adenine(37)-N6)-methyltransferase [Martelella mediterranea]MCD1633501.1 tRNA1(Val) (adenine(37)-N6)-methyltransferase [Martelella mediterranea]